MSLKRLLICASDDSVLFSGVSAAEATSLAAEPERITVRPPQADADDISETAPTLMPPRPSGTFARDAHSLRLANPPSEASFDDGLEVDDSPTALYGVS